jgi:hypothetical protein
LVDELFNRSFELNLGGTRVASQTISGEPTELLRCVFSIELSRARSANTAEISVYNLAETTRAKVSQEALQVELEAGYVGLSSVIFNGKLETGTSTREGVDWVTTFQSTDGGKELREGRINLSFKQVNATEAFKRVAEQLGVGLGNAIEKMTSGNIRGALTDFANGLVMSGPAQKELDRLAKMYGYQWSIQAGQLQLLGPDDAISPGDAIILDKDRGMVGTPQAGEKGIVEVRALLNPHLTPGRVVSLRSRQVTGFYRVEKTNFLGDTRGQDWYADLELKPR